MKPKLITALLITALGCQAQTKSNDMRKDTSNVNPLLCDPETGICEIPAANPPAGTQHIAAKIKPVKILYYTDPICSSCWGIEPQLRKLKLQYGDVIEIEYRMGGLLPDWSYNSGGISKPSDVARHWDEVSLHYQMPIDGDVWLTDPLASSYPPSIAFKAAQLQDKAKAVAFMRVLREMVFLQKKNITKWEHMEQAALQSGLDAAQLKTDYEGKAKESFTADLEAGRKLGVRGFPTIFISNEAGQTEMVYGSKPYALYETAVRKVFAGAMPTAYAKDWKSLFAIYPTLTQREFAELSEIPYEQAMQQLNELVAQKQLTVFLTKNGAIWSKK